MRTKRFSADYPCRDDVAGNGGGRDGDCGGGSRARRRLIRVFFLVIEGGNKISSFLCLSHPPNLF